jgi:hypothetical protein
MGSRHTGAAGALVLAVLAAGPAVPTAADGKPAPKEISYAGNRGHAVYASFVVRSRQVVGLFVGGPCLPNVSLVEDGETKPVPIRDGRFRYTTNQKRYRVSLTAAVTSTGSYKVSYRLENKSASSSCHYTVVARRMAANG